MGRRILEKELKGSFNFFIKEANLKKNSKGYGLIRDKNKLEPNIASIASVGYGLAALVIGVEHKWISYKYAYTRANRTFETFIKNMEKTPYFLPIPAIFPARHGTPAAGRIPDPTADCRAGDRSTR